VLSKPVADCSLALTAHAADIAAAAPRVPRHVHRRSAPDLAADQFRFGPAGEGTESPQEQVSILGEHSRAQEAWNSYSYGQGQSTGGGVHRQRFGLPRSEGRVVTVGAAFSRVRERRAAVDPQQGLGDGGAGSGADAGTVPAESGRHERGGCAARS